MGKNRRNSSSKIGADSINCSYPNSHKVISWLEKDEENIL